MIPRIAEFCCHPEDKKNKKDSISEVLSPYSGALEYRTNFLKIWRHSRILSNYKTINQQA